MTFNFRLFKRPRAKIDVAVNVRGLDEAAAKVEKLNALLSEARTLLYDMADKGVHLIVDVDEVSQFHRCITDNHPKKANLYLHRRYMKSQNL